MTKMFGNLTTDGLEVAGDTLGGGGAVESGAYDGIVKAAYVGKSNSSNAQSITVILTVGNREIRDTQWITNRNGENFYVDKNDSSKRHPLPGYTLIDELCYCASGKSLAEQDIEEKVLKIYSFEERKEVNQSVPVLTDLTGQAVTAGVIKQIVDRNIKQGNEYVPSGETREENVFDKFFHTETKMTVYEGREGVEDGLFYEKWVEKNTGKTRNKAKGKAGTAGVPGRPDASAGNSGAESRPKSPFAKN